MNGSPSSITNARNLDMRLLTTSVNTRVVWAPKLAHIVPLELPVPQSKGPLPFTKEATSVDQVDLAEDIIPFVKYPGTRTPIRKVMLSLGEERKQSNT